ncbi:MAG: C39 family peptidase [Candidatus Margulisiibacteriota bacterium]
MKRITIVIILIYLSGLSNALPQKSYIPIPFLCQAPFANWSQPWQDACEEAAIIMAIHYVKGDPVTRVSGNQEILGLVDFQVEKYGGHYDLTAEQTAKLIRDYYKFENVEVRYDITIQDIKDELAKGNPVITPMAGWLLGNPYYTPPGPVYHYMVFKGYDDRTGEFITNDMGTKRGRNYRYKYQTAYNAIHDWTGSKATITSGRKAMVVVKLDN